MPATSAPCPCGRAGGSGKPLAFAVCCGRYLDDFENTPAPDAESLMRSRYSAFVLGRLDYLRDTWHVSKRANVEALDDAAKWLGLEVRSQRLLDAEHAEVEFVARYRVSGRAQRIHERSRFVREAGRWYYIDGDHQ